MRRIAAACLFVFSLALGNAVCARPAILAAFPAHWSAPLADSVGYLLHAAGETDSAADWWAYCVEIAAPAGAVERELGCLGRAAAAAAAAGQVAQAGALQQRRLAMARTRAPAHAADALIQLAMLARRAGDLPQAESHYRSAIELARAAGRVLDQARALSGLSHVRKNQGDYYEALEAETAALALLRGRDRPQQLYTSYLHLAALYEQLEDMDRARDFQARALAAAGVSPDPLDRATAGVSMAGLLNDSGSLYAATAEALAADAERTFARLGHRPGMLDARFHQARARLLQGRLDAAEAILVPLLADAEALGQRASRAHILFRLAELKHERGRLPEAIADARAALAIYQQIDNPHRQAKTHALLQRLHTAAADPAAAQRHELARLRLRENLFDASTMRRVGALFEQLRAQREAGQRQLQDRDNRLAAVGYERDVYLRSFYALVAICLGLALVLVTLRYRASLARNRDLSERERAGRGERARLEEINARLYTSATTDPLTGLANRAHGLERLQQSLAHAAQGEVIAIGLVDVDHFKRINDTHGHLAGDAVLRLVARTLALHLSDAVVVARLGGEEFLIVLDGEVADAPAARLDEVRRAIAAATQKSTYLVTASIGWCVQRGPRGDIDLLLAAADAALYRAKAMGRNRVEGSAEAVEF
ncbi:GGDEF domain-containing protein [Tahibacter amnicola]|uniref:diguanylate cyclase n=1 Tax=Tahibacter amnicola TaxID=2976241 RepID=A0ABY6BFR4_9GAMM|nr:GGDEF domain-containing protein [Tahibacter amnicola]UXI68446.1 GGDEF domain-containing protein [Tahibacter amnicola]